LFGCPTVGGCQGTPESGVPSLLAAGETRETVKLTALLPVALLALCHCSTPSGNATATSTSAPSGTSTAAPGTSAAPTATAAAPAGGVQATCNNKTDGKCTESMGAEGLAADESCKKLGGVYTKGSTPCPKENLLGSCARADATSNLNDVDYYYKQGGTSEADMKTLCEGTMSGKWTAAPKGK
jgi:hypothetical protein